MKLFLQIILFILIEVVITVFYYYYSGYKLPHVLSQPPMFLIQPFYATLVGFLIGFITFRIFRHHRPADFFYSLGFTFSFVIYLILAGFHLLEAQRYNEKYGYNGYNQFLLTSFEKNAVTEAAFKELQSKVKNPRDLYLSTYFSEDSIQHDQTEHFIYYFTYYYQDQPNTMYFSKVAVVDEKATVLIFDELTERSEEYHRAAGKDSMKGRQLKNNNDTLIVQ